MKQPAFGPRRYAPIALLLASVMAGSYVLVACSEEEAPAAPSGPDGGSTDGATEDAADAAPRPRRSPDGGRPTSVACTEVRPPGHLPQSVDGGACAADSDCDAGEAGRCGSRTKEAVCTYNACSTDDDCTGATSVCGCGVGWARQNLCLSNSNCRTDSDCAGGERCVLSDPPVFRAGGGPENGNEVGGINYSGDALGYFCTTPNDDCNCPNEGSSDICIYNLNTKRWVCAYAP
jgi:hypothetical protein